MAYKQQKTIDKTRHLTSEQILANKEEILGLLDKVERAGIDKLKKFLCDSDYFQAPASTKYHSNFVGGLALHSLHMLKGLLEKNEKFNLKLTIEQCIIVGLLHDLCKVNFYRKEDKRTKIGDEWITYMAWSCEDEKPLGHGEKSVIELMGYIRLYRVETMMIRWHMGPPKDTESGYSYNEATRLFPAIVAAHTADYEASYFLEETVDLTGKDDIEI